MSGQTDETCTLQLVSTSQVLRICGGWFALEKLARGLVRAGPSLYRWEYLGRTTVRVGQASTRFEVESIISISCFAELCDTETV